MVAARPEPTRAQLEHAMRVSRCSSDLDAALACPALAVALKNTALALASKTGANQAEHPRVPELSRPAGDFRMRAANDRDEIEV